MNFIVSAASSGDPLLDFLIQGGAVGVLAFVVIAFMRGWIVTGGELARERADKEEIRKERDNALLFMQKSADLAQRALELSSEKRSS